MFCEESIWYMYECITEVVAFVLHCSTLLTPSAQVVVTLPKKTPGEFFEDLGMLTKLLTRGKAAGAAVSKEATKSLVEVIGGQEGESGPGEGKEEEEEEEWDWRVEQMVPTENTGEVR